MSQPGVLEKGNQIEEETLGWEEALILKTYDPGSFSVRFCDAPTIILGLSIL